mmetsp:Transcript_37806/g.65745  ORF Transcript_37806/g.65745 Transcript_37806/m.65745 type:complete len:218 (+) Transcript_37806:290-943(+)
MRQGLMMSFSVTASGSILMMQRLERSGELTKSSPRNFSTSSASVSAISTSRKTRGITTSAQMRILDYTSRRRMRHRASRRPMTTAGGIGMMVGKPRTTTAMMTAGGIRMASTGTMIPLAGGTMTRRRMTGGIVQIRREIMSWRLKLTMVRKKHRPSRNALLSAASSAVMRPTASKRQSWALRCKKLARSMTWSCSTRMRSTVSGSSSCKTSAGSRSW